MTLQEKQQRWIEDYLIIENPQERLSALVDVSRADGELPEKERTEAQRISGCVSAVWMKGTFANGLCHYHFAAESSLVRGLAGLLCRLYSEQSAEEIVETEPDILEALQLSRQVSPTRMNGLYHVRLAIKGFAELHMKPGHD